MKIGWLSDSVSRRAGGVFYGVRRMAHAMAERNVENIAFGLEDQFSLEDQTHWRPVPVLAFPRFGPSQFGYSPRLAWALVDNGLDLLITNGLWQYSSFAALKWADKTRKPHIANPHGMLDGWAVANAGWKKRIAAWAFENRHLNRSMCIRALCESEARAIRNYGLKNPICIVPYGIDCVSGTTAPPPFAMDRLHTLLYLGRLHPKKNLLALIEAWQLVCRKTSRARDWKLVIAGWDQCAYEAELRRRATELGLERSVEFIGPTFDEDKAGAYQHASAFILPSLSEGLPMVILEAWSHGKPVLMTDECNLAEGFSMQAAIRMGTRADSIAAGIIQLLEMTACEREKMGERGRRLTRERFSWPEAGAEMHRVCEWVLGGGPAPACVRFD